MEAKILKVSGMSCAHCEKAVVNALTDLGVANVIASAKDSRVSFDFDPSKLTLDTIIEEIKDIGYEVD